MAEEETQNRLLELPEPERLRITLNSSTFKAMAPLEKDRVLGKISPKYAQLPTEERLKVAGKLTKKSYSERIMEARAENEERLGRGQMAEMVQNDPQAKYILGLETDILKTVWSTLSGILSAPSSYVAGHLKEATSEVKPPGETGWRERMAEGAGAMIPGSIGGDATTGLTPAGHKEGAKLAAESFWKGQPTFPSDIIAEQGDNPGFWKGLFINMGLDPTTFFPTGTLFAKLSDVHKAGKAGQVGKQLLKADEVVDDIARAVGKETSAPLKTAFTQASEEIKSGFVEGRVAAMLDGLVSGDRSTFKDLVVIVREFPEETNHYIRNRMPVLAKERGLLNTETYQRTAKQIEEILKPRVDLSKIQGISNKIAKAHNADGGVSLSLRGENLGGKPYYMVGVAKDAETKIPGKIISEKDAQAFIRRNIKTFEENMDYVPGTWYNAADDTSYIDVALKLPKKYYTEADALKVAAANKQVAIFDIENFAEIKVPEIPVASAVKAAEAVSEIPTLVAAKTKGQGSEIFLEFDDAFRIPKEEELKNIIEEAVPSAQVGITTFKKDVISGARGGTNFRVDVLDRGSGAMSSKKAQEVLSFLTEGTEFRGKTSKMVSETSKKLQQDLPQIKAGDVAAGSLSYGTPLPEGRISGVNLSTIDSEYGVKKLILDTADRIQPEMKKASRGVITHESTKKAAQALGMTPEDVIKRKPGYVFNDAQMVAAGNIMATSADEVFNLQKVYSKIPTDENLLAVRIAMDRFSRVLAEWKGVGAEAGRTLSARRILSTVDQTADAHVRTKLYKKIFDSLGGKELTEDMVHKFALLDMKNPDEVYSFLRNIDKATTREKLAEIYINSLLSHPVTQAVNMTGNVFMAMLRLVEKPFIATSDIAWSVVEQRPRAVFFRELKPEALGMWMGFREGYRKALKAFVTEMPSEGYRLDLVGKGVGHKQAIKGTAGKIVRIPSRFMMAGDEFIKAGHYQASLYSLSYRKALKAGLKGDALLKDVAVSVSNPSRELLEEVMKDTLYWSFQTELGPAGKIALRARKAIPGSEVIVPFVTTPTNIAKRGLERTPLALATTAYQGAMGRLTDVQKAEHTGRAILGSIVTLAVLPYILEGKITGSGPQDPDAQKARRDAGIQNYSVLIDGQYYSYARIEPFATVVGLNADFITIMETMSDGEKVDVATGLVLAMTKNVTNKTYMQGLSNFVNATADPERYGEQWTERVIASTVPRGITALTKVVDPEVKDPVSFLEVYQAQLPFLSQGVKPKRDLRGRPVVVEGSALAKTLSPVRVVDARKRDKLDKELYRLGKKYKYFSMPQKNVMGIELTEAEYDWVIKTAGEQFSKLAVPRVESKDWAGMKDEAKYEFLRAAMSASRDRARGILFSKIKGRMKKP